MRVRTRLIVTFAVIAGLLTVPALFAASRLADLRDFAVTERGRHANAALALGRMEATAAELERQVLSYLVTAEDPLASEVEESLGRLEGLLAELRAGRYGSASDVVAPTVASLRRNGDEIRELVGTGRVEEASTTFEEMEPLFGEMERGLGALADSVDAVAQRDFERARAISASAFDVTLVALGAALLLALVAAARTTRVLTRPLHRLASATGDVAEGSFDAPSDLPYSRADEIGALSRAFRIMTYRLEDLDRMKSEFVGVASHELKNPVHVIGGYGELLSEEIPGELNERQREMVQAISEQVRIMDRLIKRLLDISRLESGTWELDLRTVPVSEIVDSLERSFRILADRKGIELVTDVSASAPAEVELDPELVRDEILGNLLSNAVKHTPEGGRVTLSVRGEGETAVFEVSDTGPGIPEESRGSIFERYYQVAGAAKKGGTGLGLAVAREMVEAHGGRIAHDPDAAPGATFRVELPLEGGRRRDPVIRRGGASSR